MQLNTQWRTAGMTGVRTGLDYAPLFVLMDKQQISGQDWHNTFEDIQAMERSALMAMRQT